MSLHRITRSSVTLRLDLAANEPLTVGHLRALAVETHTMQLPDSAEISVSTLGSEDGPVLRVEVVHDQEDDVAEATE